MNLAIFIAGATKNSVANAALPLAITNGDVFGMSNTGWTYMLILTFLTGVAAHGLMVFAQKTIAIGTIGITQVIQPPLAFIWSFLLLDERLNGWQIVGIAIVLSGLLAFLAMNQRPKRRRIGLADQVVEIGHVDRRERNRTKGRRSHSG